MMKDRQTDAGQQTLVLVLWRVELGHIQVQGVGDGWRPRPTPHLLGHLSTTGGLENPSSSELPAGGETLAGSIPEPGGARKVGVGVPILTPPPPWLC